MRFNKKEYIVPQTTVLAYESESLLVNASGEDYTGGGEGGLGNGGSTTNPDTGKENSGSLWDYEDGDEY